MGYVLVETDAVRLEIESIFMECMGRCQRYYLPGISFLVGCLSECLVECLVEFVTLIIFLVELHGCEWITYFFRCST